MSSSFLLFLQLFQKQYRRCNEITAQRVAFFTSLIHELVVLVLANVRLDLRTHLEEPKSGLNWRKTDVPRAQKFPGDEAQQPWRRSIVPVSPSRGGELLTRSIRLAFHMFSGAESSRAEQHSRSGRLLLSEQVLRTLKSRPLDQS